MRRLVFAANWKMQLGPQGARRFLEEFLPGYQPSADREVWFFAPAVSLATVATMVRDRPGLRAGIQHVFWEPKGAFTGETSVPMAKEAGATAALVGHSERRHVFGETDADTWRKVRAALDGDLLPVLCVGETLAERERGETLAVVHRQIAVLEGLQPGSLARVHIAYEPVWAIGTGRNATPDDAAQVHTAIRGQLRGLGAPAADVRILYGGSVKPDNAAALVAEPEIDGVLVGGASLDPGTWTAITRARPD